MRRTIFIGAAGLLAGVVIGYALRGILREAQPEATAGARGAVAPKMKVRTVAKLSSEEPLPSKLETTTRGAPGKPDTLKLLRLLDAMRRAEVLSFDVRLLEYGGHLSKSAKTLFGISDPEAAQLDAAFDAVKAQRAQIEAGNATAQRDEKSGAVVIALPTYPEAGGKIYDELMKRLGTTLGAERLEVLQNVCAAELDRSFGEMGLAPRSLTIEHKTLSDGQTFITLHEARKSEPAVDAAGKISYNSSSTSESTFRTREELVKYVGPVADKFVPAGF